MSNRLTLNIAGLEFNMASEPGLELVEDQSPYLDFIGRAPLEPDPRVAVQVSTSDPLMDDGSPVVFDSGESWLARRDGDGMTISFRSPTNVGRFWWQARLAGDGSRVTVDYDPTLVKSTTTGRSLSNPLHYPLDQLLTMLILATRNGCILHAAGIAHRGRGVAFVGRSGAGKTTLMRLLDNRSELERLSDDRLVIRLVKGIPQVFGTPWAGEGRVAANLGADLGALVFLHKGDEHSLRPIESSAAAHQLLPTTSIPWFEQDLLTGCLDTLDTLVRDTPTYDLHFRMDSAVGELIDGLF